MALSLEFYVEEQSLQALGFLLAGGFPSKLRPRLYNQLLHAQLDWWRMS
jgi:hypothetical protein